MRLAPTSLRGRLALLFAMGAAALVAAASGLLFVTLESQLDAAIRDGLQARADDIGAEVHTGRVALPQEEPFAQLVNPTGTVIVTSAGKSIAPVLSHGDLDRALRHEVLIDRSVPDLPGLGHRARFLARPVPGPDGPVVIVAGASLDAVERGRHALALAFALAGPVLVGVLGAGGWLLAGAALRPVAHMTEEADAISLAEPGRRLLQPLGDDEIAHLARTLNAMLERIEATFARERAFLDDASHELRTPLSILRAELDVALLDTSDIAETRRALRSALEEAERLSQLADDFLILAREAAGRVPLRRQPADLRDLASHVTTRLRWGTVPVVDGGDPVVACVDPARFEQVLANLLANARRHAQQQVRVEVALDQGEAVVTIADDGPGFPPDLIPVVFDRFTTADPVRHRQDDGGAGLGARHRRCSGPGSQRHHRSRERPAPGRGGGADPPPRVHVICWCSCPRRHGGDAVPVARSRSALAGGRDRSWRTTMTSRPHRRLDAVPRRLVSPKTVPLIGRSGGRWLAHHRCCPAATTGDAAHDPRGSRQSRRCRSTRLLWNRLAAYRRRVTGDGV